MKSVVFPLSVLAAGLGLLAIPTIDVHASSHREAPFVTETPKVDGTDFYMFRSYEAGRQDFVTIIANYLPLQDPFGGPNYFSMDPDALYEIHIDNDGDALEDITFQFRFNNILNDLQVPVGGKNISVPLINIGGITSNNDSTVNASQDYTVDVVLGDRRKGSRSAVTNALDGNTIFDKPLDYIGDKSLADYATYARSFVYDINVPNCEQGKMFVGQRKDPFVVNLGNIFDLVNLDPLGPESGKIDNLAGKNVTSLILELPISCLTKNNEPVIGAWTTASLRQARLLNPKPNFDEPAKEGGAWTQVSRLSSPLVNEVVIGLKDKDRFNASKPKDDTQFLDYVTNPTLPALLEILFPTVSAPDFFPRDDLVAAFLTGVDGLNQPNNVVPSEMLRLNTAISPIPFGSQNHLGVLGGDTAGFPNGRRPGDDVVDIELRVAMGALIANGSFGAPTQAPSGDLPFTDGALVNQFSFIPEFPYLRDPIPGSIRF